VFISEISGRIVERLNPANKFRAHQQRLARDERLMAFHGGGRRCGLRSIDGKIVAVLCGFARGERFHVLTQLNDPEQSRLSLSLVLRGYLVENLIVTGHTELQFIGGGGTLGFGRYCEPQRYRSIFIDNRAGAVSLASYLLAGLYRSSGA
jgi:hypothetical protein